MTYTIALAICMHNYDMLPPSHEEGRYISFGDQFFNDKLSEAENEKTTAEIKVESMVSIIIHQDTSAIPLMTSPVIDLISRPDSPNDHRPLLAATTATTTKKTLHLPLQLQQGTTDSILIKRIDKLDQIMANLIQDNKHLEERDFPEADMKEILHQRMWETNSYKAHEDHMMLYEALEKSMNRDHTDELINDLAEARRKKKKRYDSPKTPHGSPPHQPPPPLPPVGPSGTSGSPRVSESSQLPPSPPPSSTSQSDQSKSTPAPSSSKTAASTEYTAWMTTDIKLGPFVSSISKDLYMDDDTAPNEQVHSSDDEDIKNDNIPKASALTSTYTPPPENSLLAQTGDMAIFMDWFCKKQVITELKPQDLEGPTFDLIKVFHPNASALTSTYTPPPENSLLAQTGDMAIFMDWFCKKQVITELKPQDLEGPTFDLIKVFHPNQTLPLGGPPGQVIIQSDIFFNKDLKYLRYGSKGGRPALSISKMKVAYYPDVGLEKMVPDQMWIEEECKYDIAAMYDLAQPHKPRWDTTGFEYKNDFTRIDSPRAVTFRDKYGVQMIMRFNEIHKFSDGTLHQIDEALDYRVKEFKVNRMNRGLNIRFWTRKDVDRSKEFMFAIQK
nr:hypothetical protein [Tanacetum cinerariifolium]